MYTAIVLDEESHNKMVKLVGDSKNWEVIAHHMTVNMGKLNETFNSREILGQRVKMVVDAVASDHRVMAARVLTTEPTVKSANKTTHVTLMVNRSLGGKPFHSNELNEWLDLADPIEIFGVVEEIK